MLSFADQEIVALSGAHVLGRCHKDRSGFDGPCADLSLNLTSHLFADTSSFVDLLQVGDEPDTLLESVLPAPALAPLEAEGVGWAETICGDGGRQGADDASERYGTNRGRRDAQMG